MAYTYLEFEKPISDLENKIESLRDNKVNDESVHQEISSLSDKIENLTKEIYEGLSIWQKVQVARHPHRPHFSDYIENIFTDFDELHGDRLFGDDQAIIGGLAKFKGNPVVIIGHEKGNDTKSRIQHNFGMARPEGYRKAVRLMDLADRFDLPVITFIDTPGAYPGKGAEERGQAEAIASSIAKCLQIKVPLISVIIGEGGSGGAVALASSNKIIMLEHSIYSVISPEGCASILWKNSDKVKEAAESLRLTALDLSKLRVVDEIISEPIGGAHRNVSETITRVGKALERSLKKFDKFSPHQILSDRRNKFLDIGKLKL